MKERYFQDLLFLFQLSMALIFGFFQIEQMLFVSVEGVSISAYLFTTIFVGVNTYFVLEAKKVFRDKLAVQNFIIYSVGTFIYFIFTLILIIKSDWSLNDSQTSIVVLVVSSLILIKSNRENLSIKDTKVKADLGIVFRAVPHSFMAYKVFTEGGAGLSPVMIVMFHVLTITRIILIYQSYQKLKTDINRKSVLRTELWNEGSWVLVTIAWFLKI